MTFPLGHTEHTDHALVHNPRRTLSGSLTLALTWGIFGLLTGRVYARREFAGNAGAKKGCSQGEATRVGRC